MKRRNKQIELELVPVQRIKWIDKVLTSCSPEVDKKYFLDLLPLCLMRDEQLPEVLGVRGEDESGEGDAAIPADDQPV